MVLGHSASNKLDRLEVCRHETANSVMLNFYTHLVHCACGSLARFVLKLSYVSCGVGFNYVDAVEAWMFVELETLRCTT